MAALDFHGCCKFAWVFYPWVALLIAANCSAQDAARPKASELFPDKTLAYLHVDDVRKLKQDYQRSSFGRLTNDPKMKPIADAFYGSLIQTTEDMFGELGMNLDELLSIPSGELAVALLPRARTAARRNREVADEEESDERRRNAPTVAFLIDAGEDISGIQVMLQRMDRNTSGKSEHFQRNFGRLTLHSYQNLEDENEQFAYFIDQSVFVAASSTKTIEDLALVWLGQKENRKTLSENPRFTSIVRRCVGVDGQNPQVLFFIDPLAMLWAVSSEDIGMSMMLTLLPPLGLDGFQAIGGSLILSPADFDSILHLHFLLSNPREAVLSMLKPKPGSIVPENWIPNSAGTYATINWDLQSALLGAERLYNQFRGEDALNREVFQQATEQSGIDFRKDMISHLEGRITFLQGFVRPVTSDSQSNVVAFRFKNIERLEKQVLPKLADWMGTQGTVKTVQIGKLRTFVVSPKQPDLENASGQRRPQESCLAIVDDYLLVSDSQYMMQQISDAIADSDERLNESLDFQLVRDSIHAQLKGKKASAITYGQPAESLQTFYELVRDPEKRQGLEQRNAGNFSLGGRRRNARDEEQVREQLSQSNPLFSALNAALEKHELPPFSVISKHLAPRGGYLIEEDNGLHYTAFTLRRE